MIYPISGVFAAKYPKLNPIVRRNKMWIELREDTVESMSFYGGVLQRIEIQVAPEAAMERKRKGEPLWVVTDQEKLNLFETKWLREKVAFAEGRLIQSRYISLSDG